MTNNELPFSEDAERLDLSALDSDAEPGSADRFTQAVLQRTRASTSPPQIPLDPLYGLWSLPRAILIAASVLILAALALPRHNASPANAPPATIAEAVGAPADLYVHGGTLP